MFPPDYTYLARVEHVVDADTIDVQMDLGMRVYIRTRLRVAHINAPELSTVEGKAARDFVRNLLPAGKEVQVSTQKPDKYGRALADIALIHDANELDLASLLVELGMAVPYEGGPR